MNYRESVILFRRSNTTFMLEVAPENDALAVAWRNPSAIVDKVFRIGQGTSRMCGLF